jgi:hypothetical protein
VCVSIERQKKKKKKLVCVYVFTSTAVDEGWLSDSGEEEAGEIQRRDRRESLSVDMIGMEVCGTAGLREGFQSMMIQHGGRGGGCDY